MMHRRASFPFFQKKEEKVSPLSRMYSSSTTTLVSQKKEEEKLSLFLRSPRDRIFAVKNGKGGGGGLEEESHVGKSPRTAGR